MTDQRQNFCAYASFMNNIPTRGRNIGGALMGHPKHTHHMRGIKGGMSKQPTLKIHQLCIDGKGMCALQSDRTEFINQSRSGMNSQC